MIYAAYAPIYDSIGQGGFAESLTRRILAALPAPPARALDLACGTGAAALLLAANGAEVIGVDRSPQMLAIARAKARDRRLPVSFIEADMRYLPTQTAGERAENPTARHLPPASFDLAVCLYDSLNYLTGDDDLSRVLEGAARALRPGGRLVFDLNTEYEFRSWDEHDQVVHDDGAILVYNRLSYEPEARLARGRIVWFVREIDRWWRGEESHLERAWSEEEVQGALAAAGLRLLARRTPEWAPAPPDAPRLIYEAVKEG